MGVQKEYKQELRNNIFTMHSCTYYEGHVSTLKLDKWQSQVTLDGIFDDDGCLKGMIDNKCLYDWSPLPL